MSTTAGRMAIGLGLVALVVALPVIVRSNRDGADASVPIEPASEFGYNEGWADRKIGKYPHIRRPRRTSLIQRAAEGGATTNRIPVRWSAVQPGTGLDTPCRKTPHEHPAEHWDKVDAAYSDMVAAGIRPVLDVGDAPCWAAQPHGAHKPVTQCDPKTPSYPPARAFYGQWQRFVRDVATRYPEALGVEVMNEPNVGLFWGGCPTRGQGSVYGELLRRGYDAVKSVHPEMTVLTAGMAPNKDPGGYLREVFAYAKAHPGANGQLPWDAVAVHAYRSRDDLAAGLSFADSASHELDVVRQAQADEQVQGPLWVTEVGVSTVSNDPSNSNDPHDSLLVRGSNRAQAQANALVEIYTRLRDEEQVPVVIISRLVDAPSGYGIQPSREQGAGVLRANFKPKPAYDALCAASQRCGLASVP